MNLALVTGDTGTPQWPEGRSPARVYNALSMSFDRRLGLIGLIVALFGIAAFYLWPDTKWIGWACLLAAVVLVLVWFVLELRKSEEEPVPSLSDAFRTLPREGETTVLTLHDVRYRTINALAGFKWDNFMEKLEALNAEEKYVLQQFVLQGCRMLEGHAQELVKAKYHYVTNPLQAIHTKTGFITPQFNGYEANPGIVPLLEQWAATYKPA